MSLTEAEYWNFRQNGGVADLSARAKFRLTGGDRVRYLNGQVTANVTALRAGASAPACVTTAKGRLCGDIQITVAPEALLVDAVPELRESLLARLERYIIADDVVLEDVTDELRLFHRLTPSTAPTAGAFSRFGHPGHDVWAPAGEPAPDGPILPAEYLEMLRIESGLPRWGTELTEETLPPEAGLEKTHIDYHKGCYIGQETISRLKSVGHVNRHLRGLASTCGTPLEAGWLLFAPGAMEKTAGEITSATWSFALAKPLALGYLKRGSPETLLAMPAAGDASPVEVTVCELPFTAP